MENTKAIIKANEVELTYSPKVTIGLDEYSRLVRDSERLQVVTAFAKANKYINKDDLKALLDLEEDIEEGGEQ